MEERNVCCSGDLFLRAWIWQDGLEGVPRECTYTFTLIRGVMYNTMYKS